MEANFTVNVSINGKDINEIKDIRDKYLKRLEVKTAKYKNSEPLVLISDVALMVDDMLDEIIDVSLMPDHMLDEIITSIAIVGDKG